MGCTDGREPTVEELDYEKRENQVIKAIHELPLSKLTVADGLFLYGAFYHRHFGISERDVERMEEMLTRTSFMSSEESAKRSADIEFSLVSSDREVEYMDEDTLAIVKLKYRQNEEPSMTANVGAWYSKAVYWKNRFIKRKENDSPRES